MGGGGLFPVENMGNGDTGWGGWGVGWGLAKEPASQCARVCRNYPLANYPVVSPRCQECHLTISNSNGSRYTGAMSLIVQEYAT